MTTQKQTEMKTETVYYGDCLKHLKQWIQWNKSLFELQPTLADLIYLDPPWNSKANYNVLFGQGKIDADDCQTAQETAFVDIWQWGKEAEKRTNLICGDVHHDDYFNHPARKSIRGIRECIGETGMLAYCAYMAERLALLKQMLKETGSIYLHCDPTASHYLKMIMDDIFGAKNFRNEITWKRCSSHALVQKGFDNVADTILFYAKDAEQMKANKVFTPVDDVLKQFPHLEKETGRYFHHCALENKPNKSSAGQPRKFLDRTVVSNIGWKWTQETLDARLAENPHLIYWTKSGRPRYKVYADAHPGNVVSNIWTDVPYLASGNKERTGYPTQKPLALLKRIIKASTNEGDVVLDPFYGCGTAVVAAAMLKRKFVGVDISFYSVETVTYSRLNKEARIAEEDIQIKGIPEEMEAARFLAKHDPFDFEIFAVEACRPGMVANKEQRRDKGIDGRGFLLHPVKEKGKKKRLILVQVKAGKPTPSHVRDFANVIRDTKGAVAGVFIILERNWWTRDMQEIADRQGTFKHEHSVDEYPRLQHWHVGQFYFKTPHLRLPNLPEMADPLSGKEMISWKQTGFLTRQYAIWKGATSAAISTHHS